MALEATTNCWAVADALRPHVVCLKRPKEEVIANLCRWIDQTEPMPTNHWAAQPAAGWHHDPHRTRIYPQYDTQDREESIRRYWDEYYQRAEELAQRFPRNIRIFDSHHALNTEEGLRDLLSFVEILPERQVLGIWPRTTPSASAPALAGTRSSPTPQFGSGMSAAIATAGRTPGRTASGTSPTP